MSRVLVFFYSEGCPKLNYGVSDFFLSPKKRALPLWSLKQTNKLVRRFVKRMTKRVYPIKLILFDEENTRPKLKK